MNNKNKSSRRNFFKQTACAFGGFIVAPGLLPIAWPSISLAEDLKFVKPGKGLALSLNYTDNKMNVKKELQIEVDGVKFQDQKCSSCLQFTKDPKGDYGKCTLFSGELVKVNSWCMSWAKKV
jgi:hypothetical protein